MYYFAYGTNMSESRMRALAPFTKRESARLEGYRLVFNKQANTDPRLGFANISSHPDSSVHGVLYEVTEAGLVNLDISEGSPDHYFRREMEVVTAKGERVIAEVYVASEARLRSGLRPSRTYMANLLAGGDILPKEYQEKLRQTETYD